MTTALADLVEPAAGPTTCPLTGEETGIERTLDPEFRSVSLDELETLVRNEWRHRLGASSYVRSHSRRIIRALLIYALAPESPIREGIVRQLVWWELTRLGAWGLGRAAVMREFQELGGAVRHVLSRARLDPQAAARCSAAANRELRDLLDWPEPEPASLTAPD